MNNIDEMPAKCKSCSYWEACEYPGICQDTEPSRESGTEITRCSDDTISRQAALDALNEQIEQCNKALGSFDISPKDEYAIKVERASHKAYKEQLENLPTVQPKRGRWIKDGDAHYCSECGVGLIEFGQGGEPIYFVEGYNRANHERRITTPGWCSYYMQFCPHCGADMRGGET